MARVEVADLHKSFGSLEVIHGTSFDIDDGEFVILIGPSGCGKSTMLRMIAGLEGISAGEVSIDGTVVNDLAPRDRDIAMVFQDYALYPHMDVATNMGFSLKLNGHDKAEIKERVGKAAAILNLEPLLDRKPAALSGGQRQRVAMGRSIVRAPKVFLFDEPLSNLDAKLRVQMRSEIRELQQRLGTTTIYVTHDQTEAMTMADKVVVLNGGRIEQVGPPLELYRHPVNLFVATFIGSPQMNIISGAAARAYDAAEIGVRPEHLDVATDGAGWKGKVVSAEYLGSDTFMSVETEEAGRLNIRTDGDIEFSPGTEIVVRPKPDKVHRFDEKGWRIV
ncbi:ABC transporter ATP-binding protein [Martelella endophytica]|uniref:Glycerol-3-phosphate ABC transporter ATPase n=1 Tax=Martelella endophytica TaxID=1486262 RepID=A0A0D5LRR7_MAREN|nr:sn-glycerol-3-phosphate ABC transporter ATP-binding protein UgpC [Martelella endophytica]AJY46048.1 glycerol-3-phosphate ABC transporter ATPase [Martelella endophytica]